jgi:nicotinate-nucleotide--dimethylbenzimidazole phosphoribosyltransferase
MTSGLPFDDLRNLARQLPTPDTAAAAQVEASQRAYAARGAGGLGTLGDIAAWLSAVTGRPPRVLRPVVALFAGTRLAGGVSNAAELQAFVDRTAAGGSAVNQACGAGDIGLKIFDLALDVPVGDITREPALDEKGCAATVAFGMEAVAGGTDLLVLAGWGGQAGDDSAAALLAALLPTAVEAPAGPAVEAVLLHRSHLADPLETLRRLGGRETAALAGAILAARMERVPVILDGRAALAAAAVVSRLSPGATAHCRVADSGGDAVADAAALALGFTPILQVGLDGRDGTAGAVAAGIARTAAQIMEGAAEFVKRA